MPGMYIHHTQPVHTSLPPLYVYVDAVERVQTGLLGHPDSTAAHVTKGWDKYAHPNGRPLHADEALLTDVLAAAWPYIASMAQTSAWDMIPALLKTTAPRWLADLELKKCVVACVVVVGGERGCAVGGCEEGLFPTSLCLP